jgi:hypothetical protein
VTNEGHLERNYLYVYKMIPQLVTNEGHLERNYLYVYNKIREGHEKGRLEGNLSALMHPLQLLSTPFSLLDNGPCSLSDL